MYYKGSNPSALRSRNEIINSFFSLLNDYSFDEITVTQIMGYTQYSRQTFYKIFHSKDDIIECYLNIIFSNFIKEARIKNISSLCEGAKMFFSFFDAYKDIISKIIKNGKSSFVQRMCREYLRDEKDIHYQIQGANNDIEQEYSIVFMISGMVAMLELWIKNAESSDISSEQLADLLCRITEKRFRKE